MRRLPTSTNRTSASCWMRSFRNSLRLQVYQAVLKSQASEHAARMVAMHSATANARELAGAYELQYNKMRQQTITNDVLDIVGGAEALGAA